MRKLFKRQPAEPMTNSSLIERYEASLNSKDETIERLLHEKRDLEFRLFKVSGELIEAKQMLDRILTPLRKANEARRAKAQVMAERAQETV